VPNLLNKETYVPSEVEQRKTDVKLRITYQDTDSIQYIIPEGYNLEYKPDDVEISSEFGKYNVRYELNGNKLLYIRTIEMKKGIFPKEKYNDLIDFKKKIVRADQTKVVFVSET